MALTAFSATITARSACTAARVALSAAHLIVQWTDGICKEVMCSERCLRTGSGGKDAA